MNCSEIANQIIIELSAKEKQQPKIQMLGSMIDFCIGSTGATLIEKKIEVMRLLQKEEYRVHVDYSSDMHSHLTEQFLVENNVRFIIEL